MSGTDGTATEEQGNDWAREAGTPLDQGSIDSLFGEGDAPSMPQPLRNGLEVLVGSAVVGYGRLPMLDIIVDRFARLLTSSVRKFTSDNCEVAVGRTRSTRVGDFLNRISLPAMIAVIRAEPWDGSLLATMDASLIGSVVDVLLGGRRNQAQPIEGRPYTPIERTLVERLVAEVVITDLKRAFETVCPVDFLPDRYETTPTYAAITELSAAAVAFSVEINMDGGRGGKVDFLIPYSVLEPVRDILGQEYFGKKQGSDPVWSTHLREEVPQVMVELQAVLEKRMATVQDVANWKPGSLLVLDRTPDDLVEMFCDDMLVALGRIGEQNGRVALQVEYQPTPAMPQMLALAEKAGIPQENAA